jgi:DNA polymerase-3 subunit epsilon
MNEESIRTYTVFDVETPNSRNDSICSIALVHVEEGEVTSEAYYLVDPEAVFDSFNIGIHHITPAMVRKQPKFPQIWEKIGGYFTNGIVIAHNANFDLSVLSKALQGHMLDIPDFSYLCTMKLSRKAFMDMEKYRLDYLCSRFDIELRRHHDALCDTQACHSLFQRIQQDHGVTRADVLTYRFTDSAAKKADRPVRVKSFNILYGLVRGITCDRRINPQEMAAISAWVKEYRRYAGSFPYYEVIPRIEGMLADGVITEEERRELVSFTERFITKDAFSEAVLSMQILFGIVDGISCDAVISTEELESLRGWMEDHDELVGNYPYDVIGKTLGRVLEDGRITASENDELVRLFRGYLQPMEAKQDGRIEVAGTVVCLTGNFENGSKEEIGAMIEGLGGVIGAGVTRKTGILVVGGEGSGSWSYCNYGTKVKKAMEMRSKGADILIIGEDDFLEMLKRD